MDGATALWSVRSRFSTSDFDRTRRAQEVLLGMFHRMIGIEALTHAPEIYDAYINSVETNLTLDTLLPLIPVAANFNDDSFRRYAVGSAQVWDYIVPESGAWVLWPNQPAIQQLLNEALYGP
jgi:anionic cell wall polymer biosynthesis LytR-Cps2A-Psr (LCP) family protein